VLVLGASPAADDSIVVKHRVASQYLPLGILREMDKELAPAKLSITIGDRILLCSDGLTEAINPDGAAFGMERYEQVAIAHKHSFDAVVAALEIFCGEQAFNDDVSFVEIQCVPGILKTSSAQKS
jgi:serine phosphatase RsbU (regulator of sigma subunit)